MREESVIEKSVSLPAIRRLAMEAGFSRMRVVPLRSSAAYVFDYAATPADGVPLRQMWDETLRLCPGEHARFVLYKGDDPPANTLLPAHQLVGRLDARIVLEQVSAIRPRGTAIHRSAAHRQRGQRDVEGAGTALRRTGHVRAQGLRSAAAKFCGKIWAAPRCRAMSLPAKRLRSS